MGLDIFIFFLVGLQFGSFLNVVVLRLTPTRHSKTDPTTSHPTPSALPTNLTESSCCPHCRTRLRAWDLIPVLSYLWLRGRCRYCHHPISWRYPLVELTVALAWAGCAAILGLSLGALAAAALVTILIGWCLIRH